MDGMTEKKLSFGEWGLSFILALVAVGAIFVAAKAWTPEFAFHAYLFAAAAIAGVFAIGNRYFARPAHTPQEIDGKPNYNFGPVKFATLASLFWGIAGFTVGLYIALELSWPIFNLDLPLDQLWSLASLAYFCRDLCIRWQCAARDLFLCCATHLPRPLGGRSRAMVRCAGV